MSSKKFLRERVFRMLGQRQKSEVISHFKSENVPVSTIYRWIKRWESGISAENLPKTGRPPVLHVREQRNVAKFAQNKVGVSQRKLAIKYNVSRGCIRNILKKHNIERFKRQKAPKYSQKQLEEIPKKCRKLRKKYLTNGTSVVMDDEKYFTFTNDNMPGNDSYYTADKDSVPDSIKYKCKLKFEKKVLVWVVISEKGISKALIRDSSGPAISADVYQSQCLPIARQFIAEHHSDGNYIFWPDLASCHYARTTQNWLRQNNIKFVEKDSNPPNIPKARPIEDFWSILCRLVYRDGWEAKSTQQLKRRIQSQLKKMSLDVVQSMMSKVRSKVRKIEEEGPFAIL